VRGENDRFLLPHSADQGSYLMLLIGIETIGRLIKDKDVGIMNDRLREAGAMSVAL
jgi:hypothetical protein